MIFSVVATQMGTVHCELKDLNQLTGDEPESSNFEAGGFDNFSEPAFQPVSRSRQNPWFCRCCASIGRNGGRKPRKFRDN